jgi:hypothetical protein
MRLPIDALRLDGGTQPRGLINFAVVEEYRDEMLAGAVFPAVVVFYDGTDHWVGDGFHRIRGAKDAHQSEVECDVRQGTREDAVWFSCGANQGHGLRRTNQDKQRAVDTAIKLRPGESDRMIAEHCGVAPATVGTRRQLFNLDSSPATTRTGRDGKTRTTTPANQAAGGKASAQKREERKPPTVAADVPDLTDFVSAAPEPQRVPPLKVDPLTGMLNAISAYPLADLIRARDFIDELIRDRSAA